MQLHDANRTEDIIAAAMVSAVESYNLGRDYREARNAANRAIYRALKAEGYHREYTKNQQYRRREIRFCQIQNPGPALMEYIHEF